MTRRIPSISILVFLAVITAALHAQSPLGDARKSSWSPAKVSVDYDRLALLHENNVVALVRDVPLPGGSSVTLRLRPMRVMAEGASVRVMSDSGESRILPGVRLFSGEVTGVHDGYAYLAVSPRRSDGYVIVGNELYLLSAASDGAVQELTVAKPSAALNEWFRNHWRCGLSDAHRGATGEDAGEEEARELRAGTLRVRIADIFIEADHQFRGLFATAEDAADYALALLGAISDIYRRDVGVVLRIPDGYLRVWETVPPWGAVNDFDGLSPFRNYWVSASNPLRNIERTVVHLLTTPVFGGVAYLPGICSFAWGYGLSSVNGFFPDPVPHTSSFNWDIIVVAHELGHNFGAPHTFDLSPPIECEDGSGPDKGTIMSYCHLNAGGTNNVGLRFHARIQDIIRSTVNGNSCFDDVFINTGDYDYDGDFDAIDLDAALMCLNLEFHAGGCVETFDVTGDGVYNICDYDALARLLDPGLPLLDCNANGIDDCVETAEGSAPDCNLNGLPDSCDMAGPSGSDCNGNGILDECDIAAGAPDCNVNGLPDSCDEDCDGNGVADECDLADSTHTDCNANAIPDVCDIASGTTFDCNGNGIPDSCDGDCNNNGLADECDLASGAADCNDNELLDECELASGFASDCNGNQILDVCELAAGTSLDCNENGILDECDVASGFSQDCNSNGVPDNCDVKSGTSRDCPIQQPHDCCEATGLSGCSDAAIQGCVCAAFPLCCLPSHGWNELCVTLVVAMDCGFCGDGIPDECVFADCNGNCVPDEDDIATGQSLDADGSGIPDECECVVYPFGDLNLSGLIDVDDVLCALAAFADESACPRADLMGCGGNGVIDVDDMLAVLNAFGGNPACDDPCW